MKLILKKKPKGVTIVEGFPGFGLIGTIASEFLMDHLKMEKIGTIEIDEIPAMVAIHQNKIVEPMSIHYNKDYNLVIVHAINIGKDLGWKLADMVLELADTLQAKEIICLEGVGSPNPDVGRVFFYTNCVKAQCLKSTKELSEYAKPLMEGIVVGPTGALLAKDTTLPLIAFFAEAHSNLPDSKAAAEIIKALDAYTGLNVDPKPLLKQAQEFEEKLKGLMVKGQKAEEIQEKKRLSYVG